MTTNRCTDSVWDDHDIYMRTDWDGADEVVNGMRSWQTPVCRSCKREGDELYEPCEL